MNPTLLLVPALAALAGCQPAPRAHEQGGSEPTKVSPEPDAHEAAGNAVPQAQAEPGETSPPAKGGY
jgi:hypothetical protein